MTPAEMLAATPHWAGDVPDLTDWAVVGVLLGMLVAESPHLVDIGIVHVDPDGNYGGPNGAFVPLWEINHEVDGDVVGERELTLGEALAKALLYAWRHR